MSFIAFILIFASASLHVTWNTIAKKNHITLPLYFVICFVSTICWIHVPFWTPVDILHLPLKVLLLTIFSVMSDCLLYCHGLSWAYANMNMSTAYPIMRALPIIFTLLTTSLLGIQGNISLKTALGMFIVFIGCLHVPLKSYKDFSFKDYCNKGMLYVVIAAMGTTGYTIFDSLAMHAMQEATPQISKSIVSMTYYSLREIILSSSLFLLTLSTAKNRAIAIKLLHKRDWHLPFAGICASATYILVLLAMMFVTNVSYVQVFRQIGLPIGMLAGMFILKERCSKIKFLGCMLIIIGLGIVALF